jgi:hypothetical protein
VERFWKRAHNASTDLDELGLDAAEYRRLQEEIRECDKTKSLIMRGDLASLTIGQLRAVERELQESAPGTTVLHNHGPEHSWNMISGGLGEELKSQALERFEYLCNQSEFSSDLGLRALELNKDRNSAAHCSPPKLTNHDLAAFNNDYEQYMAKATELKDKGAMDELDYQAWVEMADHYRRYSIKQAQLGGGRGGRRGGARGGRRGGARGGRGGGGRRGKRK